MATRLPFPLPEAILDLQLKFLLYAFNEASRRLHRLEMEHETIRDPFRSKVLIRWDRYEEQLEALAAIREWLEERGGKYTLGGVLYEVADEDAIIRMTFLDEVN